MLTGFMEQHQKDKKRVQEFKGKGTQSLYYNGRKISSPVKFTISKVTSRHVNRFSKVRGF